MRLKKLIFIQVIISIILLIGWVQNITKLAKCDFKSPYKAEVVYAIGTVAPPIGAITGWLDMGK